MHMIRKALTAFLGSPSSWSENAPRKKTILRKAKLCLAKGVFERTVLRIHLSDHVTKLQIFQA